LPFQTEDAPNAALRIIFYVTHEQLLHLVTTLEDSGS